MKNKGLVIFLSILMFAVGIIGGIGGLTYITLPYNEELVQTADVYYSKSGTNNSAVLADGIQEAEAGAVSVHFLELGNKYTGDCTYIKVGTDIDILIDCGSKTNSIPTVANYLNEYVTDGVLEYVIVTHAHEDHYAGFATSTKISSIFDLYECETIITFSATNQRTSSEYIAKHIADNKELSTLGIMSYASTAPSKKESKMYANFNRELTAELNTTLTKGDKAGQKPIHLTASKIVEDSTTYPNSQIVLDQANNINLQVLNHKYYNQKASSDNDYSVCVMLNQGEKHFLFTGDLEEEGEISLVQSNSLPQVDLYKAGHHGSKTSSTMELLSVVRPKVVCVCCCAGSAEYTDTPENQFPTKRFINNVSQFTTRVYVTTLYVGGEKEFESFNGNIVVMAKRDDSVVGVYCSNNTLELWKTDWFKEQRLKICQEPEEGEQTLNYSWIS